MAAAKRKKLDAANELLKEHIWEAFCDVTENNLYEEWVEDLTEEDYEELELEEGEREKLEEDGMQKIHRFTIAGITVKRLLRNHPDSPLASLDRKAQLILVEEAIQSSHLPGFDFERAAFIGNFSDEWDNCSLIDWPGDLEEAVANWDKYRAI